MRAPIEPMLARVAESLPPEGDMLYEPKWDGFRAIVFKSGRTVSLQSRDLRPLERYFPDLQQALAKGLPGSCVLDGEIVIATAAGLDFDALQLRLHPAASRVAMLAARTPASFVAFDLLSSGRRNLMALPQLERRRALEALLADARPPLHLTPMTRERKVALQWLEHFEGAGLDGVIAKPAHAPYQPGQRSLFKIKPVRTADCVVAGLRFHKSGEDAVGSLLLGLFDDAGVLQHVGVASSFTMAARRELLQELAPLRRDALRNHPWREWNSSAAVSSRMPGARSRWSAGKDLSWQPLRPERVCEVKYDHLQGDRFRHAATFMRWRPDKRPPDCRYDQLEVVPPYELVRVFAAGGGALHRRPAPRRALTR